MKIQNFLFLTLVLTLISSSAFSQAGCGVRTGAAVTTLAPKGHLLDNNNVTFSYTVGAFATLPVSKCFSLQPEVNYVRKGRSEETYELNTSTETDFKVDYLQVPVLFQFRDYLKADNTGSLFYIEAGPYAGFALNTLVENSNGGSGTVVTVPDDKKTDWGAAFGIGFQTPIWNQDFRFNLRYDMGFSEIANQPDDYRTKALSLTVGIAF